MGRSFAHLHTHTEFSMLDGASRVGDLVAAAVADGQPALGITDHGNLYGVLDFYKACREQGINPVIGTEAYMAGESRHERPRRRGRVDDTGGDADGGEKLYYHLTLLAASNEGYANLLKLSSRAYLEGYFYKPRVDWELLGDHADGLVASTGCLGGVVNQALLRGDIEGATARAARLQDIFGKDSLFIELQDHGMAEQKLTNPRLVDIARRIGAPLLATNDSHYTHRHDSTAHDALLCVQTGSTIDDPNRFKLEGEEHYLKSAAEMRALFAEVPEACDNTLLIAERASVEIEFGTPQLPRFPLPEGVADDAAYLRALATKGAEERYGAPLSEQVTGRLDYELGVIAEMGFSAYFLIVWDLIAYARRSGIRVGPGRGSAAGSLVSYSLRITDIDPLRYDLLFERFLNPGRRSMPDIDMDFDDRYRDEMIRYAADRYGRDHVAQIVTFSTIKARAAVRDASRVLGLPYAVGDRIAKAMPPLIMGRDTPLAACFEEDPKHVDGFRAARELREMYDSDDEVHQVLDVARGLEGLRRQDGIHAAAVVITEKALTEHLPVQRKPEPGQAPEQAPLVTQYEMGGVESLGLLKMDFLGLRNLSVIETTLDLLRASGVELDIDAVPLDDDDTLALLRKGDSIGVFQLEGGPMRSLMRALAPTSFDDVAALVALYRPGPMAANMHMDYADRKNGRQPVTCLHPELEELLGDTYGLMIYQESVMRVAQRIAGYSLEEADNLRKACAKKIRALILQQRQQFVDGCERNGYGAQLGNQLFDVIEPFADYAFPKSHAYGYGFVAYQTAYLKAHHPVEYLAALLTSVKDSQDRSAVYLNECRALGIKVLVPDVNLSMSDFTARTQETERAESTRVEDETKVIPFGLSAVRNVGGGLVALIVAERERGGPFADFHDFCDRVDPSVLNKRAVESLVKAGAFDALGHQHRGLLAVFETIVERTLSRRRKEAEGQFDLFSLGGEDGAAPPLERPAIPDLAFDKAQRLAYEKEMLGLYVSDHPLMGMEHRLRNLADTTIADLRDAGAGAAGTGDVKVVAGVVTNLVRKTTKRGDLMAVFVLEDLEAAMEVMVFPKTMLEHGAKLVEDAVVCVKGRLDSREDSPKLICLEVTCVELASDDAVPLRLTVPPARLDEHSVDELKRLLLEHPGDSPVFLQLGATEVRLPPSFSVDTSKGLLGELRVLLGPGCIRS